MRIIDAFFDRQEVLLFSIKGLILRPYIMSTAVETSRLRGQRLLNLHYGLSSFQGRHTKFETIQRKLLHFCELTKSAKIRLSSSTFDVKNHTNLFDFSQQAHAPPTARPLAAPASVGAALCLKIHFCSCKFLGCYIEAAQNFFMYVQFSIRIGHKKLPSLNWF